MGRGEASGRACVRCSLPLPEDANVCPSCGHDYRPLMSGHAWEEENTPLPPIGGVLIALSGFTQIIGGLLWMLADLADPADGVEDSRAAVVVTGVAVVIVGLFALMASPYAMTRRRLALSLVAGLAALGGGSLVVVYAVSYLPGTLSLVGLLFIALARDEFVD